MSSFISNHSKSGSRATHLEEEAEDSESLAVLQALVHQVQLTGELDVVERVLRASPVEVHLKESEVLQLGRQLDLEDLVERGQEHCKSTAPKYRLLSRPREPCQKVRSYMSGRCS